MKVINQRVNILLALYRVIKLLVHFGCGAIKVFLFARHYDEEKQALALQAWSKKLLNLLDIRLVIQGDKPEQLANTLIVANHISWLDILIVFTIIKPRFVAKKEIRRWPIICQLTKVGNTIFIDRNNKRDISHVNHQLSQALSKGDCIAVFPEGTTSIGYSVLPFKASLFEPILQSQGSVLPVGIQYKDSTGQFNHYPAFIGDMSLLASVWNVLRCNRLTVSLTFNPLLDSRMFTSRNQLAVIAQQAIEANLS